MKNRVHLTTNSAPAGMTTALILILATGLLESGCIRGQAADGNAPPHSGAPSDTGRPQGILDLSPDQVKSLTVESVTSDVFPIEKEAVGNIDFDGDLSVSVFPPYQGTITSMMVELGADVQTDQPLYSMRSPDLIQAESTLISAAATFDLTSKELARVKALSGISVRETEQATSDQQTAEGALKAGRDAVRVFGKTDTDIDGIIASRQIDPALVVRSPMRGTITSKNAQPGYFVQPGTAPAPYSVANVAIKWMLANVSESDVPFFHVGHPVRVTVMAYPDRVFTGKVSKLYETVDPNTHRETIRSEIEDPRNELRPGMLANFVIGVRGPEAGISVPTNAVVREGDGTMTAWVTTDRRRFVQRVITIGRRHHNRIEILDGLQRGEMVVADGAIFLSNMLAAPPSD
jgi:cobalt-zinc-cadmium efflux system membrane fusion protein